MRIKGVGKVVATFVMFLAASALAIHESKPPPPPVESESAAPVRVRPVDEPPPSRAIHDAVPPWVKYAAPPAAPPKPTPPPVIVIETPPRTVTIEEGTIELVDAVDKCPDQLTDGEDNDGCPDPDVTKSREIIEIE